MTFTLTRSFPRLWSLEQGTAMIVTDLHGDWEAYRRYRDRFVDLAAHGQADCLIFTGDLIHSENPDKPDKSLDIVLDVEALLTSYGQAIIYLCGNHELPHIYGMSLAKSNKLLTPAFETALGQGSERDIVIDRFSALPFFIRTRAGVALTHAGAAAPMSVPGSAQKVFTWNHQCILDWAEEFMANEGVEDLRKAYARLYQADYTTMAQYFLNVFGPDDPRYNHLLRGFLASNYPDFHQLLWPVLFTHCEQEYGLGDYKIFLQAMLQELAVDFVPQRILVAGHMPVRSGGYQIVAQRHLRLASADHAMPLEAGRYLLFDTARPIHKVEELLPGLHSVF